MPWTDQYGIKHHPIVKAIYDLGRKEDTYCFNEPVHHAGVFNGVLTGNCTEIIEYSDKDETAVCNLASLGLPTFVKGRTFDFEQLRKVTKIVVRNLNRVIDINFYPVPETRTSNLRHRPVGLGVQGLADVFAMLRKPWEAEATRDFHQRIFEHIYFAALEASNEAAVLEGPYETFPGSPASKGILQFDMWKKVPLTLTDKTLDWTGLRAKIVAKGLRNSLLIAPMPTASTSQILGFNECFEPFTSNIYARRTLSGEYIILNKHLIRDLLKLGLWNEDLKNQIIMKNGSVQGISVIPEATQTLFKTAWEIKQRTLLDMAADRGAFICQSQSLNLFVAEPTHAKLSSMQFYAWELGLKTGQYYLRTKAPVMAQKFTIDPDLQKEADRSEAERQKREGEAPEGCLTCSA
jgi:ribonucleoside-diphosphate reductase alpha chain